MSSIGSATASQQAFSPLKMLQAELASEVKAGTINSADQSALSSALSDIDSAMRASKPSAGSRPSPDEMKAKIEGLIDDQVSSGNLTSEQAEELKGVFESAFKGGPGGAGGPPPGGPGGAGGSDSGESTDAADTNKDGTVSAAEQAAYNAKSTSESQTTSTSSSSDSDVTKLLQDFLDSLKESQSKAAGSTYGGSGSTLASKLEALIVNYQV